MTEKSESLLELAVLAVPWVIGTLVFFWLLFFVPMRTNSPEAYLSIGVPIVIANVLTWLPPFRSMQIRRMRRKYPQHFKKP